MKRDQPKPGRRITRRALAAALGLSLRTIDEHGLARGVMLTRQDVADRAGLSLRTLERRRAAGEFPRPSLQISNRPFWSVKAVDNWKARQAPQLEMTFDGN